MQLLVLATLLIVGPALAQTPPVREITTPVGSAKAISPKVQFVTPDGTSAAAKDTKLEQRTQWVQSNESARDFLSKNGLVVDNRTIEAFKKLNPNVRSDGTIPAGSKISIFAPERATHVGQKALVNMSMVAKYSVSDEVAKAKQVKMETLKLPASAYERASDLKTHRVLASDIDKTAALVAQRAGRMSAMDLVLSKYYLATASANAANVAAFAKLDKVSAENIAQLQVAVAPVQSMQAMMSTGGAPFQYRSIEVSVKSKPGAKDPPPLRVYVLPGGILDKPETFDEDFIRDLLVALTFERLTTPSKAPVAQGDMRIWVGPDHEYPAMAKRVRDRKPITFTPLRPAPAGGPEVVLQFTAPDDIVTP